MKKPLLILSVLSLAAGAAHAQSSVTLAGTVDTAVTRGKGSISSRTQLTSGSNATSKIIIRGTEDLGGGMSALFHLESGFTADNGAFQNTQTNNPVAGIPGATGSSGLTFNRRSIVGLRGGWGELHLGRDWAPMYDAYTTRYDPFGLAVGLGINYSQSITSQLTHVRVSNAITYETPKFGGFSAQLAHWLGEGASGTATKKDGTGSGLRLMYDQGPISARVHYGRTEYSTGDAVYRAVAGSYDFGMAKVSFNYNKDDLGSLTTKGPLVGLFVPVGAGTILASYSAVKINSAGSPKASKLAIGYVHNLSKRTAVYTTLAQVKNKNGSRVAIGGSTTGANESSTGFDLGVRHNF